MNKPKVQRTTVSKAERILQTESMKTSDVQVLGRGDATLYLQMCRHRLAFIREMLVDGKMIVHPSETPTLFT